MKKGMLILVMAMCLSLFANENVEAAKKNAWVKKSGKTYYHDSKGQKAKGLKDIKGKYYFFDKQGVLYKNGWKTIKGKKYYFSKKSGAASTGAVKIGKKKYLFTKKGRLCGTGIQKYEKKYYYTKKGIIQTGLKTVKGKTYYFKAKGPAKTGWFTYKGKKYYFGANGAAVTGTQKIGGKTYQFSNKGVLQKTLADQPAAETKPELSKRPVEPMEPDPDVTVPKVQAVENTETNLREGRLRLNSAIGSCRYVENWAPEDWEPKGYKKFSMVLQEAKVMLEATDKVIEYESEWITAFNENGKIINRRRGFNASNYPYTATELFQEAAKLEAYREQCLVMQKEQVLTYYPEQSKAIFDAINEYRKSKGVEPLTWGENWSKVCRLEAGYCVYVYQGTDEAEDLRNFMNHFGSQNGAYHTAGRMSVEECVQGWIDSPGHEWLLRDESAKYGAVAYYTYNSATTGVTWNAIIFGCESTDDIKTTTHAPESVWPILLECETSNKVF